MKSRKPYVRVASLVSLFLLVGAKANADVRFGEETWNLRLGTFLSDFDTNVKLSGPNGGGSVNLEDVLGLDSNETVFRGSLAWRFAPRHRLMLGYLDFNRDASALAERSFTVDTEDGTYEFNAGARIDSHFDWSLIPVSYAYSFHKSDNLELAGSVGVHWFDFATGFSGSATVTPPGGTPTPVATAAEAESASGPLPVIGLHADYALSKNWVVGGHAGWFGLDYDDYSGELIDLGVRAEYWFTDNFGAGLRYSYYDIEIDKTNGTYTVGADYKYQGLEAYVGLRF